MAMGMTMTTSAEHCRLMSTRAPAECPTVYLMVPDCVSTRRQMVVSVVVVLFSYFFSVLRSAVRPSARSSLSRIPASPLNESGRISVASSDVSHRRTRCADRRGNAGASPARRSPQHLYRPRSGGTTAGGVIMSRTSERTDNGQCREDDSASPVPCSSGKSNRNDCASVCTTSVGAQVAPS